MRFSFLSFSFVVNILSTGSCIFFLLLSFCCNCHLPVSFSSCLFTFLSPSLIRMIDSLPLNSGQSHSSSLPESADPPEVPQEIKTATWQEINVDLRIEGQPNRIAPLFLKFAPLKEENPVVLPSRSRKRSPSAANLVSEEAFGYAVLVTDLSRCWYRRCSSDDVTRLFKRSVMFRSLPALSSNVLI